MDDSRRGAPRPQWDAQTMTWLLAAGCLLLAVLLLRMTPNGDAPLWEGPWWMALAVLVGFVISEPLVFHVEARNEAVSFSPNDIPLAIGLVLLPPSMVVVVRIVGAAIALQHWRKPPAFKLVLNLGSFALEAAVAAFVLRAFVPVVGTNGPAFWLLLVLSLLVGLLVGGIVIATAISFFEGDLGGRVRREVNHVYLFYGPGAVLGATTAVPYLVAPWLVLVYLVPTAVVWMLLRSLGDLRHRFGDLSKIHAFSSRVGHSAHLDDIAGVAVGEIAEHMRAGSVALVVLGEKARTVESWLGDRSLLDALPTRMDDPTWAAALAPGSVVVVSGTGADPIAAALGRRGTRSAVSVALGDEDRVLGLLVVADRQGASPVFDTNDVERLRTLGQQLSVALRKGQLHDQIQHEALHDPLTGAPNRAYFDAWCGQYLAELPANGHAAFVMLDLDRFKEVNDTLGHAAGDVLLVEVCRRLIDAAGPDAVVSRLGGDEFAIALPDTDEAEAMAVVEDISDRLEQAIDVQGTMVAIGGSLGITFAPSDGDDISTLMRRADLAMYDAKQQHTRVSRYHPDLESTDTQRLGLLGDLRDALAAGDINVHFQPKIELATGHVQGIEALARWEHPEEGDLSPEVFVSLAEQAGLVGALTERVLMLSLAAVRSWMDQGYHLIVAVNVSALSLVVEEFPQRVAAALVSAGVPAEMLVLEITERAMIGESLRTRAVIDELDRLGVRLSVDDFGTGYSSLVTLRSMPVSELKIDRRFVAGLATGGSDGIIVESTIQLAHNLGMTVVAEGVETKRTEELLREAGCDMGQGFGLCRPLEKEALDEWLAEKARQSLLTAVPSS